VITLLLSRAALRPTTVPPLDAAKEKATAGLAPPSQAPAHAETASDSFIAPTVMKLGLLIINFFMNLVVRQIGDEIDT